MDTHRISDATPAELDAACELAAKAAPLYAAVGHTARAAFLDGIATAIDDLGDELLDTADDETHLGTPRLTNERARTTNQLRMFAAEVRAGRWLDARIHRNPSTGVDLRRMLVPIGPVAVFGASNFPLAFSVPGGDTASALAAGCPVIAKAHPAHPRTSELSATAITRAATAAGMPAGTFALVHGASPEAGQALARHPAVKAVAFTGSLQAGRSLYDTAAARPEPIPVFAEMGSVNPVFLLPGAVAARSADLAVGFAASATMGVGQFCTQPGVVVGVRGADFDAFLAAAGDAIAATPARPMLTPGIADAFRSGCDRLRATAGVSAVAGGEGTGVLLAVDGAAVLDDASVLHEVFGPLSIAVRCRNNGELLAVARALPGQLTGTVHAAPGELAEWGELLTVLRDRVGRIVFNGWPTGVDVGAATHHGGPWPATTDSRFTSVGTAAMARFGRPVAWQDAPEEVLPPELRDQNPLGLWRTVDDDLTRDAVKPVTGKGR